MRTLVKFVILALMMTFFMQPVFGQRFLKKLQEKVEEKVEQKVEERVDKKVDQAIDDQLDKVEESIEQNESESPKDQEGTTNKDEHGQQRMQRILKGMGISGDPVPVEDSYSYSNLIEMHIESFSKNGEKEDEGEFITHYNPQLKNMAYEVVSGNIGEPGKGLFIIDLKNEAIIILGEENGNKTGLVYGMGSFMNSAEEPSDEIIIDESPEAYIADPNITKTGRTKTIAGYKCEEYKYDDEETESNIWITEDIKINTKDFFSTLFSTGLYSRGIPWGYIMEVTTTDKQTKERSFMQVTRVDENSNTRFSLADYEIHNLGSLKIPE